MVGGWPLYIYRHTHTICTYTPQISISYYMYIYIYTHTLHSFPSPFSGGLTGFRFQVSQKPYSWNADLRRCLWGFCLWNCNFSRENDGRWETNWMEYDGIVDPIFNPKSLKEPVDFKVQKLNSWVWDSLRGFGSNFPHDTGTFRPAKQATMAVGHSWKDRAT